MKSEERRGKSSWRTIEETLYLLAVPGMRESILEGMATPVEECEQDPGWWNQWRVVFTRQTRKDAKSFEAGALKAKAEELLDLLAIDPFAAPPRFEKPVGELSGVYSRRINIQRRLVYEVLEEERVVKVLRMWTHYEAAATAGRSKPE